MGMGVSHKEMAFSTPYPAPPPQKAKPNIHPKNHIPKTCQKRILPLYAPIVLCTHMSTDDGRQSLLHLVGLPQLRRLAFLVLDKKLRHFLPRVPRDLAQRRRALLVVIGVLWWAGKRRAASQSGHRQVTEEPRRTQNVTD